MADEQEISHEELQALYAKALKRIEDLEGEAVDSAQLILELHQQLDNAQAGQELSPVVVVTHEQQKYRVIGAKFKHAGEEYTAADLKKHPDVVKQLVEAGSGLLQKVEKATGKKAAAEDASK